MLARGFAIWTSVGLGHLAVLGALWSGPGDRASDPLLVDLLALPVPATDLAGPSSELAPAPAPAPSAAAAPGLSATRVPTPLPAAPLSALPSAPRRPGERLGPAPAEAAAASVQAEGSPPRFLERVEPAYPPRARRAGVEGSVTLRLRLSAGGRLLSAEVAVSSGSPALDDAALAAARASSYAPARRGDEAVTAETSATYRFELR